jgi:hypothetical protein
VFTACVIVSVLFSIMLLLSAMGKLTKMTKVVESLTLVGVKPEQFVILAALEVAAAAGIIIGFWAAPLGIAAGIGAVLYFIGAIMAHLRIKDTKGLTGPLVPLMMAIASLVLRSFTA